MNKRCHGGNKQAWGKNINVNRAEIILKNYMGTPSWLCKGGGGGGGGRVPTTRPILFPEY